MIIAQTNGADGSTEARQTDARQSKAIVIVVEATEDIPSTTILAAVRRIHLHVSLQTVRRVLPHQYHAREVLAVQARKVSEAVLHRRAVRVVRRRETIVQEVATEVGDKYVFL